MVINGYKWIKMDINGYKWLNGLMVINYEMV